MRAPTLPAGWMADFLDVPQGDIFHTQVEKIFRSGITAGCGGGNYCRNGAVRRDQMAAFLLKARHGASHHPPTCVPPGTFLDVACPGLFTDWIEELSAEAITGGCGEDVYCPSDPVRRDQMAVFLLKAEHGPDYVPPACTGVFSDVPCPFQYADWIEQLVDEGITVGCGDGNYCPEDSDHPRADGGVPRQDVRPALRNGDGQTNTRPGPRGRSSGFDGHALRGHVHGHEHERFAGRARCGRRSWTPTRSTVTT